jgi:hypothetical protein
MRPNPAAITKTKAATKGRVQAWLMEYKLTGGGDRLWELWYPPQTLKFSGSANYTEQATLSAREHDWQYGSSTGLKLEIPNLVLDGYCLGRSVQPLVDGLEELRKAKPKEGIFAPPVLLFAFGGRRFGPCVLTDIQWEEVAWLSGEAARLQLSITLQEVPKPPNAGTPTEPAADTSAAQKEKDGKPRKPLTIRQRQDGSAKALAWLKANPVALPAQLKAVVSASTFRLSTDTDSGDVKISGADGTALGTVGRWDGRTFLTDNQDFE